MASLNSCNFIGNVTRDPEVKFLPSGSAVCEFGMAINHNYTTQSGEKREECTFIELSAFGKTAEIIGEYAKKGKSIYVEARAKLDQWDDKTTGAKRSKIKFIVNNIQLLGGKPGGTIEGPDDRPQSRKAPPAKTPPVDPDDDIPY